jgi:hypothetical protein
LLNCFFLSYMLLGYVSKRIVEKGTGTDDVRLPLRT